MPPPVRLSAPLLPFLLLLSLSRLCDCGYYVKLIDIPSVCPLASFCMPFNPTRRYNASRGTLTHIVIGLLYIISLLKPILSESKR